MSNGNGNGNGASAAPAQQSAADLGIQYNQTLGFFDLFNIAVGVIIGSGIMTMSTRAIGMTGRSVVVAFMMSAVWVICTGLPTILLTSCIRLIGGGYTQFSLFVSPKLGGFYMALTLLGQMGHNLYAQTFATYFADLVGRPGDTSYMKIVAAIMITGFYFLNFFGVDAMSKLQNAMSVLMLITLSYYCIRGLPKVNLGTFFGGEGWMTNGFGGLMNASNLLVYSLLGGTSLMPYSPDAKNARRDIPLAAIASTLSIALLYVFMGIVNSGILPMDQVWSINPNTGGIVGVNLTVIARSFMTPTEVSFFIVGGALMAAGTTLNGVIGSVTRPGVMMSVDGWLPRTMATLHPKYKTAWKWQIFYYCMTMMPLIVGFDISQVTNMTLLGSYTMTTLNIIGLFKLPKMFPDLWEKSMFRIPNAFFFPVMTLCTVVSANNIRGMFASSDMRSILVNIGVMSIGLIYSFVWWPKVTPTVSWEPA